MYDTKNLDSQRPEWTNERKKALGELYLSHYVADIITNDWHDGGAAKVYQYNKDKKYEESISVDRWQLLMDNYYQNQLQNKQRDRFSNPVNADSVILNCIYVSLFTAEDHLSNKKFDIEHLAKKERMRSVMKQFDSLRLPVSCIANLCYLPEGINRGKKEKIIYEATGLSMSIEDIESKFSFTEEKDFKWIAYPYSNEDEELLKNNYAEYLNNRYKKINEKFIQHFYPDFTLENQEQQ